MRSGARYQKLLLSLSLLALTAAGIPAHAEDCTLPRNPGLCYPLNRDELDKMQGQLQSYVERNFPYLNGGIAVSIASQRVATFVHGDAKAGKIKITDNTLFPLASATKTFTAALIWKRIGQGRLKYDDPISKYIPFEPKNMPTQKRAWDKITVGQLLSHSSGLGDQWRQNNWHNAWSTPWTFEKMLARIQLLPISPLPPKHVSYTNSGYSLLGQLLETRELNEGVTRTWEELIRTEIIDPLRLNPKRIGVMATNALNDDYAYPDNGTTLNTVNRPLRVPYLFFAAGDLFADLDSIMGWANGLFQELTVFQDGVHPLLIPAAELLSRMIAPVSVVQPVHNEIYTAGAMLDQPDGQPLTVFKTGHFESHYANIVATVPHYGITIAILQSNYYDPVAEARQITKEAGRLIRALRPPVTAPIVRAPTPVRRKRRA